MKNHSEEDSVVVCCSFLKKKIILPSPANYTKDITYRRTSMSQANILDGFVRRKPGAHDAVICMRNFNLSTEFYIEKSN